MKEVFTVKKRLLAASLTLALCLTGCSAGTSGNSGTSGPDPSTVSELSAGVTSQTPTLSGALDLTAHAPALSDFSVRLFQSSMAEGGNVLVSPLSVLTALSMTANGAKGDTLAQMEAVLGLPLAALNDYSYFYVTRMPQSDRCKVSVANSIWFTQDARFTVNEDFLQTNADYYRASIYEAPFDDTTAAAINAWVNQKTDGMIQKILDRIPGDALMYLVNALAFDAEWSKIYEETSVYTGSFTNADGSTVDTDFMHSEESCYLEDDQATGFLKYYAGQDYAFVALLPNEGVSVEDYISSLTGQHLYDLVTSPAQATVYASMPKFEREFSMDLSAVLCSMGMTHAFDGSSADFSGLGTSSTGNIFISRILHKTYIQVDERGTRAGAVTSVEMNDECCPAGDIKTVTLDRPFVYLILDCSTGLPLFLGVVTSLPS